MDTLGGSADIPTMTSREIAELTGKEHKNVMRDIRNMLDALKKDRLSFERIYKDGAGRDQQEYALDRELTLTLVSGYDIPLRHRVVTKLAELEARPAQTLIPQTLPEALRLAADLADQRNVAQVALAIAAPKADALDRISNADGALPVVPRVKVPSSPRPRVDVEGQIDVATSGAVFAKFRVAQELRDVEHQVVESFADLPTAPQEEIDREYGKGDEPQGLMKERNGVAHVYVFAPRHESIADVEATILHESIGHVGVRRLFGSDVTQALNRLFVAIGGWEEVRKIAKARGISDVLEGYAQAIVGMIRQWLRDAGLVNLAEMGETDLPAILSRARRAIDKPGTSAGPAVERRGAARHPGVYRPRTGEALRQGRHHFACDCRGN